jgi:ATP-binding cassette subfamily F protein 3
MILSCQNISKSFGTDEILKNVSFHIEENEKAAVVGINGAGKSTLLKIIMKQENPDEGDVTLAKDKTIGYLAQYQDVSGHHTIYEEVLDSKRDIIEMEERLRSMEAQMNTLSGDALEQLLDTYHKLSHEFEQVNGYAYRSEVTGILKGLGFTEEEFDKKMNELSGGQKTRVSLGKLLVTKPDVLLLDEPTNHLDIESIRWLETFLLNYKGAVLIVSHDRYFLDRVVSKVVEIFQHKGYVYQGNYSDYAKKKAAIRAAMIKQYYNQQREIKHQEEVIAKLKSFNREKSIKRAESREKMLDKIERIEKPTEDNTDIRIVLEPNVVSGNDVLKVEGLAKAFPPLQLFQGIDFEVKRGERVALIGNNGTGKTTILKIINELLPPDAGTVTLGSNVHIGYYDQEHQQLHMEKTIFDEIADDYPNLNNTKVRNVLAAFLFTDDDVYKRIEDLSGGERGRVALAKLMLSDANFLILDEPTNHLDITSKEILEEALKSYTGTVLFVSHDRYFINQTATRILELTGETVVNYIGNYDYYLEKHDQMMSLYVKKPEEKTASDETPVRETAQKVDWQTQKAEQARIRKIENSLKKTEERISELEGKIAEIDEECAKPEVAVNSAKLGELTRQQSEYREELDRQYEMWEELSLQLADTSGQ